MLKKVTLLVTALLLAMPSLFAQKPLFLLPLKSYYATNFTFSDTDPEFTYNAQTGTYEGVSLEMSIPSKVAETGLPSAFKLYTVNDDGEKIIVGPGSATRFDLSLDNPYQLLFEVTYATPATDGSDGNMPQPAYTPSSFFVNKFFNETPTGKVTVAVNLTIGLLTVAEPDAENVIPEAIYLWGNSAGDAPYAWKNMATLLPTEDNAAIFSVEFDVPYVPGPFVYDSDEDKPTEEDTPDHGFAFQLNLGETKMRTPQFGAPINARTMEEGQAEATFQISRGKGGAVWDLSPGLTVITFNYETFELTLVNKEVEDPGNDDPNNPGNDDPNDPNNPDNPGNDDPDNPDNPDNPGNDDPTDPDNPDNGVSSVLDADAPVNVFTLEGVQVLRGAKASEVEALPAGIYIVNGKKVVK